MEEDTTTHTARHQNMLYEPLLSSSDDEEANNDAEAAAALCTVPRRSNGGGGGGEGNNSDEERRSTSSPTRQGDESNSISRNIPLTLWYNGVRCAGEAIWVGSVLAAYVYLLKPNNPEMIGFLSALEGIVQFVSACVAGVLGDMYRRDTMLKVSSVIGIIASALIVTSCINTKLFACLAVALAMNGAFDGIGLTASMALFADSIQKNKEGDEGGGDQSSGYYFTLRMVCTTVGQLFGPIGGLLLFYMLGDVWTISNCAKVIASAQIVLLPAFVMLCLFRDDDRTPPTAATTNDNNTASSAATEGGEDEDQPSQVEEDGQGEYDLLLDTNSTEDDLPSSSSSSGTILFGVLSKSRFIAISASLSDILCAIAGGVSLRYFTIFQLDNLQLGPVAVNILDALSCVLGCILMLGAQHLSTYKYLGRCRVSILFKIMGVVSLVVMIDCYKRGRQHPDEFLLGSSSSASSATPITTYTRVIVCLTYLLQNAFLNSTSALTQSLAMDHVPSHERAKWSALESINIFGWCGSAAIGGLLVKHFGGVLPVFYISAFLQLVGTLPLVALIASRSEGLKEHPGQVLEED